MPVEFAWPEYKGLALNFVAQIYLRDFGAIPAPFTQSGTLFFFVQDESVDDSYGTIAAIIFAPEVAELTRRELPASYQKVRKNTARAPYPTCKLHVQKILQLAHPAHPTLKKMTADQRQNYEDIYAQFDGPETSSFLGFRKCWDGDISDKNTLLLELTSDDHPAFTWGDVQTLSFFVPTKNLAALNFTKVEARIGE